MSKVQIVAFYHFADLKDYASLQEPLLHLCESEGLKGTILLADEGVNGTVAGSEKGVNAMLASLRGDARLAALEHKVAHAEENPFYRMKVRLKNEIVTMGVPDVNPNVAVGRYVDAEEWNEIIQDPNTLLIDTRNQYEISVGKFKGAIDPQTNSFREFPAYVDAQLKDQKNKTIAMYCTGGIRCEKATSYLVQQGFKDVVHLKGGILKYIETVKDEADSLWEGDCFVFDNRVTVDHGLNPGDYEMCPSCRTPVGDVEKSSPHYEKGVSCPKCDETLTDTKREAARERQRQIELAEQRGSVHIGA